MRPRALSQHRKALRAGAWALFAVVALMKAVVVASGLPWRIQLVMGDALTYFAPMALTVGLGVALGVRAGRADERVERGFWFALSVAVLATLVAELHWTWFTAAIDSAGPAFDSWERILHLIAGAIAFVLLVRMTRFGLLPVRERLRFYVDIVTLTVALWPVVYLHWTRPLLLDHPRGGVEVAALAAVYPLFGGVMTFFTSAVVFASAGQRRPAWERLLASSLWLYGVSLVVTPLLLPGMLTSPPTGSAWLTLGYAFGYLLLATAMVYRLTDDDGFSAEPWPLPAMLSQRAAAYVPVVSAMALLAIGGWTVFTDGSSSSAAFMRATWVLAILLAFRSWMAAAERGTLKARVSVVPSTGLLTRDVLDHRLLEAVEHSGELGHESSVVVFDARPLHPTRHPAGLAEPEPSVVAFARLLDDMKPEGCEAFHVSGDRFAVLLENAGPSEAAEFALRVWIAAGHDPEVSRGGGHAAVCAGVASFPVHAMDSELLLASAELAVSAAHGVDGEPVVVFDEAVGKLSPEERTMRERMRVQRTTVRALAEAVDARDPATRDHSVNVAELATALAQVMGLGDREVQVIGLGALMHDVGKVGVRDEVLLKPDTLGPAERSEVEDHCVLGERILVPARLDDVLPLVRWHHERWDGSGYPDGISGEDIPLAARILAVCDAFETITTGRPYSEALSLPAALDEIERCAGTQFDPGVVAAFVRMVRGLVPEADGYLPRA